MIEKEKAELCGAIIGDGWIESRETDFFLAGNPTEDKEYYDLHMTSILRSVLGVETKPKNFPYWGVYGVSLHKRNLIRKLLDLGLPTGKKVYNAYIPEWIANSDKDVFFSFLRGLFDTDGNVFFERDHTKYASKFNSKYHGRPRVRINSVSSTLMSQVFDLLTKYGVSCKKRVRIGGFKNNRNNRDVYIIEINRKGAIKWLFEEVGLSNPKHNTKYLIWKRFGFCPPSTSISQRECMLKNIISPYSFYTRG